MPAIRHLAPWNHILPRAFSRAQIDAGNYPKPKLKFQGLDISVENPRGSIRSGRSRAGHEWQIGMQHHYGYIRGTLGRDGDHFDCYVGPLATATHAYIVNQMAPPTFTRADEQKAMLGFPSLEAARTAYLAHYDDPRFLGSIVAMPMDEFKTKVLATLRGGPKMLKGFVQGYTRRGPGGRMVVVKPFSTRTFSRPHDDEPDLFSPGPGFGGNGGADHGLSESQRPAPDTRDVRDAFADRDSIGSGLAVKLRTCAIEQLWPPAFTEALADAIAGLAPAQQRWLSEREDRFRITYRANLDAVPESMRAAFRSAQAVTVNHNRIEFWGDRLPDAAVLRHELVHLAWHDLDSSRWRAEDGPATPIVNEAVTDGAEKGEAILAWAHSRAMRARKRPAPDGVDSLEWAFMCNRADSLRRNLKNWSKQIASGDLNGRDLTGILEIYLALPSLGGPAIAQHLGLATATKNDEQLIEMWIFAAAAKRLGVNLTGAYTREEMSAYRAGVDTAYADRLFAALAPKETTMNKAILFLKAIIPDGAASDLFATPVQVQGHTRGGKWVAPYQAERQKRHDAAPSEFPRTNGEMREHMLNADEDTYLRTLAKLAHRRLDAGGQFQISNSLRTLRFNHPDHKSALEYRGGSVMIRQGGKWVALGNVGQSIDSLASSLGVPTTYERLGHAADAAAAADPGGKQRRALMEEHARALRPFFVAHDRARDAWASSGSVESEHALDAAQRDIQDAGLKRGLDRYGVGEARDIHDESQEQPWEPTLKLERDFDPEAERQAAERIVSERLAERTQATMVKPMPASATAEVRRSPAFTVGQHQWRIAYKPDTKTWHAEWQNRDGGWSHHRDWPTHDINNGQTLGLPMSVVKRGAAFTDEQTGRTPVLFP